MYQFNYFDTHCHYFTNYKSKKMKHIRYINSSFDPNKTYVVVNTENWSGPLDEHPSIVQHPESFEIADCEIPVWHDTLYYTPE